jgi:nucleotide-binding universal stress UspA family protein
MKKFIVAFDGLSFSDSALSYAIYLAKHCNAHLVAVFLDDFTRRSYSVADMTNYEGESFDQHMHELDVRDEEERKEKVAKFEHACQNGGVSFSVHRDKDVALFDLINESVYADLLIISASQTLTRYEEAAPTRFIKDLLSEVQCPVLLVPMKYKQVEKLILLYDGEPSSVFAVRAFSYLFEGFKNVDTEVLTIKSNKETLHIPDSRLIKEFIRRHYPKADYIVLKGEAEDEILKYLRREKKEAIVVLGAYQRSRFSRVFKPSMADTLLQHTDVPLFIAHNKQ